MSFCTAVNCMDGRVQLPVIRFLMDRYSVRYVDSVTEPGPNRILTDGTDTRGVRSILRRVDISVKHHGSRTIAVVGHADCTGNPSDDQTQAAQTLRAAEMLRRAYPDLTVVALWVGADWQVSLVPEERREA